MTSRYSLIQLITTGWLLAFWVVLLSPITVQSQDSTMETLLSNLKDGVYQFCTEPAPQNWHDGAGVCLNAIKQGTTIDGYY